MRLRLALWLTAAGILAQAWTQQAFSQQVPRPATEFAIHMTDGSQTLLSQYKGKVVLLVFFFTTCPHCQHSVQILTGLQKEYGPRGVQVVAAAFNDGADKLISEFNTRFQVNFPTGYAARDNVAEYVQHAPGRRAYVPEFLFIDRKGNVREQHSGEEPFFQDEEKNVRAAFDNLLKEPAMAKKSAAVKK